MFVVMLSREYRGEFEPVVVTPDRLDADRWFDALNDRLKDPRCALDDGAVYVAEVPPAPSIEDLVPLRSDEEQAEYLAERETEERERVADQAARPWAYASTGTSFPVVGSLMD